MQKLFLIFFTIISILNTSAQSVQKDYFEYNNNKIYYSLINSKENSNKFVIFLDEKENNFNNFQKKIKKCKIKCNIYYFNIPKNYYSESDLLAQEFIIDILSKKKLIDKDLIYISKKDYTKIYEETKKTKKNRYKGIYLNNIKDKILINNDNEVCEFINN